MDTIFKKIILQELNHHKEVLNDTILSLKDDLIDVSKVILEGIKNNKKIIICGNGGSNCDAQNMASELIGRYKDNRDAIAAISLSDIPSITAISNDYNFDIVFSRQVKPLANHGDIFIGISTSGNSKNIINAAITAKTKGCKTIAFTGINGGELKEKVDLSLNVPSQNTARIQEMHILLIHIICELIEIEIFK